MIDNIRKLTKHIRECAGVWEGSGVSRFRSINRSAHDIDDELTFIERETVADDKFKNEVEIEVKAWRSVFGHLGSTPDVCGNAIHARYDEYDVLIAKMRSVVNDLTTDRDRLLVAAVGLLADPYLHNQINNDLMAATRAAVKLVYGK